MWIFRICDRSSHAANITVYFAQTDCDRQDIKTQMLGRYSPPIYRNIICCCWNPNLAAPIMICSPSNNIMIIIYATSTIMKNGNGVPTIRKQCISFFVIVAHIKWKESQLLWLPLTSCKCNCFKGVLFSLKAVEDLWFFYFAACSSILQIVSQVQALVSVPILTRQQSPNHSVSGRTIWCRWSKNRASVCFSTRICHRRKVLFV